MISILNAVGDKVVLAGLDVRAGPIVPSFLAFKEYRVGKVQRQARLSCMEQHGEKRRRKEREANEKTRKKYCTRKRVESDFSSSHTQRALISM